MSWKKSPRFAPILPNVRPRRAGMSDRLSPKDRMKIARVPMSELEPAVRALCFEEVNLGLTADQACTEATRCLSCNKPACIKSCPVGVKIREIVTLIRGGDYLGAARKMREDNSLPAI